LPQRITRGASFGKDIARTPRKGSSLPKLTTGATTPAASVYAAPQEFRK
jgi:hypothetical protein